MEWLFFYWFEIYLVGVMTCFLMISHVWKDTKNYNVGVITITVVLLSSFSWALFLFVFILGLFRTRKEPP